MKTPLNVLYAKKAYQKKWMETYVRLHDNAKNKKDKMYYHDRARYHTRKYNAYDREIKKYE